MATTPSSHSRTSSTASSSTTSSRSSSPTYRLFPRTTKPLHTQNRQHQTLLLPSSTATSPTSHFTHRRRHTSPSPSSLSATLPHQPKHHQLTTSIERSTVPVLVHLHSQLSRIQLESERDRIRRQIQRQETVLTLSRLLKVWGNEEESSAWSDDSDDEVEDGDEV